MSRTLHIITFCLFILSINSCEKESTIVPLEYLDYNNQNIDLIYPYTLYIDSCVVSSFTNSNMLDYQTNLNANFYKTGSYIELLDSTMVIFDTLSTASELADLPYTILPDKPVNLTFQDKGEWDYLEFSFCFVPTSGSSSNQTCLNWWKEDIIKLISEEAGYYVFGSGFNVLTLYFRFEK